MGWELQELPGAAMPDFPRPTAARSMNTEKMTHTQPIIPVGSASPPQGRDVVGLEIATESDRDD